MNNYVGTETGGYYAWLSNAAEQARKNQKENPDRATILAACQLRGAWILSGCPKVNDIKFEHTHFHQHPEVYKELVDKIEDHAKNFCVAPEQLNKARREVEKLTFPEILAISSMKEIFEMVSPNLVLVMDVMQQ